MINNIIGINKKRKEHLAEPERNSKSALLENIDTIPKDNLTFSIDEYINNNQSTAGGYTSLSNYVKSAHIKSPIHQPVKCVTPFSDENKVYD